MNVAIVLGGLVILVGLALLIGGVDAHSRKMAWRRIAAARRDQHDLDDAIRRCLESPRCASCPVNRFFGL